MQSGAYSAVEDSQLVPMSSHTECRESDHLLTVGQIIRVFVRKVVMIRFESLFILNSFI